MSLDYSTILAIIGAIGSVVSLNGYLSTARVERDKPRVDLRAALSKLREDILELSSAWVQLGIYLKRTDDWDPTARFGDQTSQGTASTLLPAAVDLYKRIFEYNRKIADTMLDIFGKLGNERLAVSDEVVNDACSLIEKLNDLRCGELDNARADALTSEVIARASNLVEDLQTALNAKAKSAGAS